ncbi:MAG: cobalt-precorrin-5B (C(1))-methyltransferase, partial [Epsilonproteobacteria bacterium]
MLKVLKKGYTTGVHTSFAFKSALQNFVATKNLSITKTIKMDNDDLDVTKGCEIVVSISSNFNELELNQIEHKPYILKSNNTTLEIYAGVGVGVVTKDGLKPQKNYPAINPKPLEVLEKIFSTYGKNLGDIYCTVSVTNGEQIATQTANAKVGVVGGISILGTTGFVKPISATAYICSIEEELNFALANAFGTIIFALGNSAYKKAIKLNNNAYIIEIGNFIYDGI